jgi:hypothetical protein
MALFNELYLLAGGGTLWSAADDRDPVGQFAVLECIDYRWYESLDVRLYGSFALMMLWPRLDKAVLEAFARAIPTMMRHPGLLAITRLQPSAKPPMPHLTTLVRPMSILGKRRITPAIRIATSGRIYPVTLSCRSIEILSSQVQMMSNFCGNAGQRL